NLVLEVGRHRADPRAIARQRRQGTEMRCVERRRLPAKVVGVPPGAARLIPQVDRARHLVLLGLATLPTLLIGRACTRQTEVRKRLSPRRLRRRWRPPTGTPRRPPRGPRPPWR